MNFKPMCAPNEELPGDTVLAKLQSLQYPLLASPKYDGFRCLISGNKDRGMPCNSVFSKSLKPYVNLALNQEFSRFGDSFLAAKVIEGELYCPNMNFNELSSILRSIHKPIPGGLQLMLFDIYSAGYSHAGFEARFPNLVDIANNIKSNRIQVIKQKHVASADAAYEYYQLQLKIGCDGIILRNPSGIYKQGRCTLRDGIIYKIKPCTTWDAQIVDVLQSTMADPAAAKSTNELGYSVTSKKKADRILVDAASCFVVMHNGIPLKVNINGTADHEKDVWLHRDQYIGQWIEYKGMMVGAKDLPRSPRLVRYRKDLS
jgi:DNA ligase-1